MTEKFPKQVSIKILVKIRKLHNNTEIQCIPLMVYVHLLKGQRAHNTEHKMSSGYFFHVVHEESATVYCKAIYFGWY